MSGASGEAGAAGDERTPPPAAGPGSDIVFTVGHSTRLAAELVALLRGHAIEAVADVRRFPGSRRHPWFGRDELAATLREAEIGYVHLPELGGRRGKPSADSPNGAWRVESFRAYADAMATEAWRSALVRLEELAHERTVAMMCAEAVPWRCHRRLISDALVARGWQVRHILAEGRADPHALHEAARVRPDGLLVYPAPEDRQTELL